VTRVEANAASTVFAARTRASALAFLLFALPACAVAAGSAPGRTLARPAASDTTGEPFTHITSVVVGTPPCDTCPPRVCPDQPTRVTVRAGFSNLCGEFRSLRELPVAAAFTVLQADLIEGDCSGACPDAAYTAERSTELPPPLAPGPHAFLLVEQVRSCRDSTVILSTRQQMITYESLPSCGGPVPIDSLARMLVGFGVAPDPRCAADTLSLLMFKNGCPPCTDLTGLGRDAAGGFRATLDWRPNCVELACVPETLSAPLGRLPAGHHSLTVRVDVRLLLEPQADSTISYFARVEFDVPPCDTTVAPCMSPFLVAGAVRSIGCALTLDPAGTGELTLSAHPTEPLGGLQGRIDCPPPFRILRASAPEGMDHLFVSSVPEGRGIRYVIFTDLRFPIAAPKGPVLKLEIAADRGASPGARGNMLALITLAADTAGGSVPLCDPRRIDPFPIVLCVSGDSSVCDANGDGHTDVRDLVSMASCLRTVLTSADTTVHCRDCDGDSLFTGSDVLCCARRILRRPLLPRDSVQHDARLRVSFDPLQAEGDHVTVGVRVSGAATLGAVLLQLDYPGERWRATASGAAPAGTSPGAEDWLPVVDTDEPGHVYLGGLRMRDDASDEIRFELALTPIAPPLPGDRIEAEGADLAAPDGTVLTPQDALPVITLDAPSAATGTVSLSSAFPNPFGSLTSFVVTLPRAAQVDLAIHDLAGRRVATIAHGALEAGRRSFTWDGAGARDGLYFVRLTVDGQVLSTRVVLLKESH